MKGVPGLLGGVKLDAVDLESDVADSSVSSPSYIVGDMVVGCSEMHNMVGMGSMEPCGVWQQANRMSHVQITIQGWLLLHDETL